MVLGLGYSFRKTGGGLLEWYFVSYEAMFLFWPWDFELRFALPVAPLAFFTCGGAQSGFGDWPKTNLVGWAYSGS
jgi:hypothetical protein